MSVIKGILKGVATMAGVRLISAASVFVMFWVMARVWNLDSLGQFAAWYAVFLVATQLPLLGLSVYLSREIARYPGKSGEYLSTGLVYTFSVAGIFVIGTLLIVNIVPVNIQTSVLILLVLTLIPSAYTSAMEALLVAHQRLSDIAKVTLAENVTRVAFILILLLLDYGITAIMLVMFLLRMMAAVMYFKMIDRRGLLNTSFINYKILKTITLGTGMYFFMFVGAFSLGKIDISLISVFKSPHEAGLYTPAYKLFELGIMLPGIFVYALFPVMTSYYARSSANFTTLFYQILRLVLLIGLPLLVIALFVAGPVLTGVFGNQFAPSIPGLLLLLIGVFLLTIDQLYSMALFAVGREDLDFRTLLYAITLYFLLMAVLTPYYGGVGAAWACLLALFFKLSLRLYYFYFRLKFSSSTTRYSRILIAALLAYLVTYLISGTTLVLGIIVGLAVYLAAVIYLGALNIAEIRSVWNGLRPGTKKI